MINNPDLPVFFEIDEIKNHLQSMPSNNLKLYYLKELYKEFVVICYNYSDKKIQNYLTGKEAGPKYYPIPYYASTDKYQTHISRSKYINLLRDIDRKLLPFVRKEILMIDESFEEDHSKIIKDYPVFDFNIEDIFKFIDTLKKDKVSYINLMIEKRIDYFNESYSRPDNWMERDKMIENDELLLELKKMYITFKRYPELINEKHNVNIKPVNEELDLFKNDKTLCGFDLDGIKKHAKKFKKTQDAILYLIRIRKEALQNKDLIPKKKINYSFFSNLTHELDYYNKKQILEDDEISKQSKSKTESSVTKIDPIRLHWQDDDTLIPYLMKRLFDEGFINNSDFELRKEFIEQSFYKKSGKIFTAKEVSTVESNTNSNTKNNYMPRKAHKVDRVIGDLKSKRDEITQKKTSRTKKK